MRCAIYTRKSSEEGLEQDFNSLDAQREACEAYIRSQAGEGWRLVRKHYDDGGYSGGTLDRPALEQLLADINAEKIDTVVVYKVDRLTRSLADFAKIVEAMDTHAVSFVSVTQQFNTTTSMGRLTLNMLLSFAQFEREVTGERIRDKIAASKRKGLWMGGPVPLGYEPNGRTLAILEAEAETVRTLFRLYLELGTVQRVKEEADGLGLTTKVRLGADRRMRGGQPLSRGHIYQLLSNPIYAGRIPHKGEDYEGQHPAIIDPERWDVVQKQLAAQAPDRPARVSASNRSPLRGKLFDEAGALLTPSHAVKSGRRYRYYVSRDPTPSAKANAAADRSRRWRLPAREIERLVGEAVVALFADRAELARLAREAQTNEARVSELLEGVRRWSGKPLEVAQRVDLGAEEMTVHVDLSSFLGEEDAVVRHVIPARIRRRGVEMRLVLDGGEKGSGDDRVDPALLKAIVRGRRWFEDLASGRARSLLEIAEAEGVSHRYVGHLIPLAFLAPDIIARILSGTQPVDLTTEELTKRIELPLAWTEQRALMVFD
jgi:DNA invertase Pin-like site-specific DNA recombinase